MPVFLVCYLLSFVANEIGFLPNYALQEANAQGWMICVLFGFFFAQLSNISVYIFVHTLAIGCMILLGSLLLFLIIGFLLAKVFKIPKETGMLFSLSSLFGNSPEYFLNKEKGNVQALMTSYHFVQAVAIFIASVMMMYR